MLEQFDHYLKQTYRNRCRISGANGPIILSIPVINVSGEKSLMKDIRIDYTMDWQKVHWKGITSGYASSPYFEFIADDLIPFYENQYTYLIDFNIGLLECALTIMELSCRISFSEAFKPIVENTSDPRHYIHPKKDYLDYDPAFRPVSYNQVFIQKHGFIPNLSILDLLFNEGMNAKTILGESIVQTSN